MDEKQLKMLADLGEKLPDSSAMQTDAMLASNIMARPLARMREGQASHEALRAKARFSTKSPAYKRQMARKSVASHLVAEVDSEVARLKIEQPEAGDERIAVYGYVRKDGKAVEGAKVSLVGANGVSAYILTDEEGAYSLSVEATDAQSLEVQIGKNIVMSDKQSIHKPTPLAFYRIVDLDNAKKPKPEQKKPAKQIEDGRKESSEKPASPAKRPGPKLVADLKKMTLHEGLGTMAERGISLASITLVPGDGVTPRITGAKAAGDRKLALEVSVADNDAGHLKTLSVLVSNTPKSSDVGLGSAAATLEWLESNKIGSPDAVTKATTLDAEKFRKKFNVKTIAEARLIKRLLRNATNLTKGVK